MLRNIFIQLTEKYAPEKVAVEMWEEIERTYSERHRHYHTIHHLEYMYTELLCVKPDIEDYDAALYALFYHDIIYNVLKKDNEDRSADHAAGRLKQIAFPGDQVARCLEIILSTKGHAVSAVPDVNYFTDADLSVLGASASVYQKYAENVRKEYGIYPDLIYKPGRRKVLQHFLGMPDIFKTKYFHTQYEKQARKNLEEELSSLS